MQQGHPIAFFSHTLPPTHRLKAVYEQELIAIVLAVQKWPPYSLGRRFTVRTGGLENTATDALSQVPTTIELTVVIQGVNLSVFTI